MIQKAIVVIVAPLILRQHAKLLSLCEMIIFVVKLQIVEWKKFQKTF